MGGFTIQNKGADTCFFNGLKILVFGAADGWSDKKSHVLFSAVDSVTARENTTNKQEYSVLLKKNPQVRTNFWP